jgi:hypothetical protein
MVSEVSILESTLRDARPRFGMNIASHQNALDIFPDWFSAMPEHSGLKGGPHDGHFNDARVTWASKIIGGFAGKTILELGPYEAYNSYQFDMFGAASVISIEANVVNFLKCLVVKNIFNLQTTFLHGDFISYMEQATSGYDICWASGVLYHMTEPLRFLNAAAKMSDRIFLWTQYYDDEIQRAREDMCFFDAAKNVHVDIGGREIVLHHRSYVTPQRQAFSGGSKEFSYWMKKDDIIFVLGTLGYTEITMGVDNPQHPAGPACFFFASRPRR